MLGIKQIAVMGGVLISALAFSPLVLAQAVGTGGMAGSAAFDAAVSGKINGAGTAAAIGKNGAGSWAFNDSSATDKNAAGAMGSSGVTTVTGMDADSVTTVQLSGLVPAGEQVNTAIKGPDILLQSGNAAVVKTTP